MRFSTLSNKLAAVAAAAMAMSALLATGATAQVAVKDGMTADSHCGTGYCITAVMSDANAVNYTLVVPDGGKQLGWYAIGQGTQMSGANMAINWVNGDMSTTTSHRSTTGHATPQESAVTVETFSVNMDVSRTMTGMTIWSWNWPVQSGVAMDAQSHIFSMATTSPSSSDSNAQIYKHIRHEQGIMLDLTKPYTGGAPAGLPNAIATGSTSMGSSSGQQRDLSKPGVRIYLVHMIFMILGWQLCFPIGILLARYGRTMFRWFPVHRAVQSVGFLFVFIAFFLAVGNQAMLGKPHFYSTHTKLGISLFILIIVQVLLGFFSHEIRKRMGSRMVGYLHMPLGILLYVLSVWTIHEGFNEWQWGPPAAASYVIYAWAALCAALWLGGLFLIPREIRQSRDGKDSSSARPPSEEEPVMSQRS